MKRLGFVIISLLLGLTGCGALQGIQKDSLLLGEKISIYFDGPIQYEAQPGGQRFTKVASSNSNKIILFNFNIHDDLNQILNTQINADAEKTLKSVIVNFQLDELSPSTSPAGSFILKLGFGASPTFLNSEKAQTADIQANDAYLKVAKIRDTALPNQNNLDRNFGIKITGRLLGINTWRWNRKCLDANGKPYPFAGDAFFMDCPTPNKIEFDGNLVNRFYPTSELKYLFKAGLVHLAAKFGMNPMVIELIDINTMSCEDYRKAFGIVRGPDCANMGLIENSGKNSTVEQQLQIKNAPPPTQQQLSTENSSNRHDDENSEDEMPVRVLP